MSKPIPGKYIDTGDHRFRPRFVRVADLWKGFWCGDEALSFPDAAGLGRSPEGQLPPRAPRLLIGQGRAGGGARLTGLGLGNAGSKVICL